jgi:hypothetical protein
MDFNIFKNNRSKRHIAINDEKVKKYDVEENFSFSPSQKTEYVSN